MYVAQNLQDELQPKSKKKKKNTLSLYNSSSDACLSKKQLLALLSFKAAMFVPLGKSEIAW